MTNVFTSRMSLAEVQHALSVVERQHVSRLLAVHATHQPLLPHDLLFAPEDIYVSGDFVRGLTQCNDCFPALTAARMPRTTHFVEAVVDEQVLVEPEEKAEE